MKNLLADLDAKAGKTAYQTYTIRHGIETFQVLMPLANAVVFETEIAKQDLPTRQAVLEFVQEHGGELKI